MWQNASVRGKRVITVNISKGYEDLYTVGYVTMAVIDSTVKLILSKYTIIVTILDWKFGPIFL